MNIKEKKREVMNDLEELKEEATILLQRIERNRNTIKNLPDEISEEEIREFDEEYDLEAGFKHIEIF